MRMIQLHLYATGNVVFINLSQICSLEETKQPIPGLGPQSSEFATNITLTNGKEFKVKESIDKIGVN